MILFNKKLSAVGSQIPTAAITALAELQEILFLDAAEKDEGFVLNPDKEHDSDIMERIDDLANRYGLRPRKIVPFK